MEQKKTKRAIKFNVQLNDEQKVAKSLIYNTPITAIIGKPGTGKTMCAINAALDLLFTKQIGKIYITRPTIEAGNSKLGYLPGALEEKYSAFLRPIEQAIEANYSGKQGGLDKDAKVRKLFSDKKIEILTIQHARGVNIDNAILVVDEAQNLSKGEAKMLLTRITKSGRICLCGDLNQSDIKYDSGLKRLIEIASDSEHIEWISLKQNYRAEVVEYIDENF